MRKHIYIGLLVFALTSIEQSHVAAEDGEDILIIVNKKVDTSDVSREQVKRFFLRKRKKWNDGKTVVPVHAQKGSRLREEFLNRVLEMNRNDEARYWQKYKIKAGTSLPPEFANPQKAVFKINGAIGYTYRSEYHANVNKIVMVIKAR